MKVYEFGVMNEKTFVIFQCAAEPWWVFKASAETMAKDYHVYLFIADGHDELRTEFISIEKNARDAAGFLRKKGISHVEAMYGVSMGGASVIRFLATEDKVLPMQSWCSCSRSSFTVKSHGFWQNEMRRRHDEYENRKSNAESKTGRQRGDGQAISTIPQR